MDGRLVRSARQLPVDTRAWHTLDVVVRAGSLLVKVDGEAVIGEIPIASSHPQGRIALHSIFGNALVEFRKIEVRRFTSPLQPGDADSCRWYELGRDALVAASAKVPDAPVGWSLSHWLHVNIGAREAQAVLGEQFGPAIPPRINSP